MDFDPTGSREIFGPPSRAPILGKAKYSWEVALYPRGCLWRQTYPISFIPYARHSHHGIGDGFSWFTPLDPLWSTQTGSPLVGCGSSPHTDSLRKREAMICIYRPWRIAQAPSGHQCHTSVTQWPRYSPADSPWPRVIHYLWTLLQVKISWVYIKKKVKVTWVIFWTVEE